MDMSTAAQGTIARGCRTQTPGRRHGRYSLPLFTTGIQALNAAEDTWSSTWQTKVLYIAREGRPPAKDPAPTTQHTQNYIQASTQTKAEAILTSIYIKQSRSNTYKHTYKNTYKHTHKPKQKPIPNSTPKNRTAKIYYLI